MKEIGLFGKGNVIIVSPTSSVGGETAAPENAKVFYVVPKALADEEFQELRQHCDRLGIKVVIPSQGHREGEGIERRDFEGTVLVFDNLQEPQLMKILSGVVDELQLITDGIRDPTFELLLTKLRVARSKPRIVESGYPSSPRDRLPLPLAEPIVHHYTGAEPLPAGPVAPYLVVNLRTRKIVFRGRAIPTRPPNHIQWQPMLALAVLASRAGEIVTMAEIADGMFKLGGLRKRPITPDARDLRYKLQRPFLRAVAGTELEEEIPQMFETVPGVGLRLNLVGNAEVIGRT